jgi:SAM-dependent methyltransferase
MDFSKFDNRHYPTAPVEEGYGEWVATYERTVEDEMDIRLFERISTVSWADANQTLDLACGTGRIGAWLKSKGGGVIDGVDMTPQMLAQAAQKNAYRNLSVGDITHTPFPDAAYDLCTQSLADEHLPSLLPLYTEAARITCSGGHFVLVGYHPNFLMNGIITHFHRADGEAIGIESYIHLLSDHVKAALPNGWRLIEMDEGVIDEAWLAKKPKWDKYRNQPVSFSMVWRRE